MGFFSNLFKKRDKKLIQEQIDEIEEKVELTQKKHVEGRAIFSNLEKLSNDSMPKPAAKKVKKATHKKPKKHAKKKARRHLKKKAKRHSKRRVERSHKKKGKR